MAFLPEIKYYEYHGLLGLVLKANCLIIRSVQHHHGNDVSSKRLVIAPLVDNNPMFRSYKWNQSFKVDKCCQIQFFWKSGRDTDRFTWKLVRTSLNFLVIRSGSWPNILQTEEDVIKFWWIRFPVKRCGIYRS